MKTEAVNIQTVQLKHVFGFLKPLIVEKKAASTIRSYVASLKFYFLMFERVDLANSRLLNFFSEGAQRLAPLPVRKSFVWDAGIPLRMIRDRAHPKSFLIAAKESLFLLLMATGCRVDDAMKMGKDFAWENGVFVIPFIEKRKCKVKGEWTSVQRVLPYSGSGRICPVNALLLYSTFAVSVQKADENALFVSSTGKKAAKATLAGWIRDILREAGIQAPAGSCRSAATSNAHMRDIPIDQIMNSAGWSSSLIFFKHYQREVNPAFVGNNLLPPL
jgi:site-specific recombinase XerD